MILYLNTSNIYEETILEISKLIEGTRWQNHVFLVGGGVRDKILGHEMHDIDLVVDYEDGGILFAEWLCRETDCYKKDCNPVTFLTYGTAKFNLRSIHKLSNVDIECVQTRKEKYDKDSRKPITIYGTIKEDALRRDLTINALYMNISNGIVFDPTTMGLRDIERHILRTPTDPNITFDDDPLRILRVIRFASRYGWGIDKDTWLGMVINAHRLNIVSQERINDELTKILVSQYPSKGLKHLRYSGCLGIVLPEVQMLTKITQGKQHFGDAFDHTLAVVEKVKAEKNNRWAALLHDIGKLTTRTEYPSGDIKFIRHEVVGCDIAEQILTRLKFSNKEKNAIKTAIRQHMRLKQLGKKNPSKSLIRRFVESVDEHLELTLDLIHADNNSHSKEFNLPNQIPVVRKLITKVLADNDNKTQITLPINGQDIMEKFGLKPSPLVGLILKHIHRMCIQKPNLSKVEALEYVKQYLTT